MEIMMGILMVIERVNRWVPMREHVMVLMLVVMME